jgi:hypothetical protein
MAGEPAAGRDEGGPAPGESEGLRAEHDRLAARLSVRRSIDAVRRGAYASFLLLVTGGLAVKFAWDRWGWGVKPARVLSGTPLLFLGALAIALVCLAVAVTSFRSARAAMRQEDRDFERLRLLRRRLGIET